MMFFLQDPTTVPVIPNYDWWNSIPYGLALLFTVISTLVSFTMYKKEVAEHKETLKESQNQTISAMNLLSKQELLAETMKKTLESSLEMLKTLPDELKSIQSGMDDNLDEVKNSIDAIVQSLQLSSMIEETLAQVMKPETASEGLSRDDIEEVIARIMLKQQDNIEDKDVFPEGVAPLRGTKHPKTTQSRLAKLLDDKGS